MGFARRGAPVIAAALLVACTAGTSQPAPATSSTRSRSAAGTTAPSPAATAASPAATADPLVPVGSPDAAANALLAAWGRGDRVGARRVATTDAVATLFFYPPRPVSDRGCQDPLNGRAACAFGVGSGLVQLQTVTALVGGWYVESLTVNG